MIIRIGRRLSTWIESKSKYRNRSHADPRQNCDCNINGMWQDSRDENKDIQSKSCGQQAPMPFHADLQPSNLNAFATTTSVQLIAKWLARASHCLRQSLLSFASTRSNKPSLRFQQFWNSDPTRRSLPPRRSSDRTEARSCGKLAT